MAVSFFPFNSIVVNGVADRAANAENLAAYLAGFFSDGVIMDEDTALQVKVDSGMRLQILAGTGVINGKTILNTTAASITIEAASATLKRIDRVIFRLDENNRLMEFDVLKGTAASTPTAPALTRSGGIYEVCLAEVLVPAGATSILASYITDTRADKKLCGSAAASAIESAIKQLKTVAIKKVWENASIGSDVAAQTITLPSSTAKYIMILTNRGGVFIIPKDAGTIICYGTEAYPAQRSFTYTDKSLVISIGEYLNSGWKTGNAYLKPWQVFTLEGVA